MVSPNNSRSPALFLIVLFIAVTLAGCGTPSRMEQTVSKLEKSNSTLISENKDLRSQVEDLSNNMTILRDRLETLKIGLERQQLPPQVLVSQNRPAPTPIKLVKPRKPAEDTFFGTAGTDSTLPAVQLSNRDLERVNRPSDHIPVVSASVSSKEEPENPQAKTAYNSAFKLYEFERYKEAIPAFDQFVQKYPTHIYADHALFWMGESYFKQNEYEKALQTFQRLSREFPEGKKVPNALLRTGDCYIQLSRVQDAYGTFEKVVQVYPKSVAAERARQWLTENSNQNPKGRM